MARLLEAPAFCCVLGLTLFPIQARTAPKRLRCFELCLIQERLHLHTNTSFDQGLRDLTAPTSIQSKSQYSKEDVCQQLVWKAEPEYRFTVSRASYLGSQGN